MTKDKILLDSKRKDFEGYFINKSQEFSKGLDAWFEKIDLFLVGKTESLKKNESHLKFKNTFYVLEGKPITQQFFISLNPRFPNLEEYFQLKFTSNENVNDPNSNINQNQYDHRSEKDYKMPDQGLFSNYEKIKPVFQPKINIQKPLQISYSLLFESGARWDNNYFNPKIEFFADADRGVGVLNSFNNYFKLNDIFNMTLINESEYLDKLHLFSFSNGLSFQQIFTEKVNIYYNSIFYSNNRPHYHLEGVTFSVGWNQAIYKNFLEFQITPQIEFFKESRFKGQIGCFFAVNLNF